MKYLLNQMFGPHSNLETLLDTMTDLEIAVGTEAISVSNLAKIRKVLNGFEEDPEGMCGEFFQFIATAPLGLSEQAAKHLNSVDTSWMNSEQRHIATDLVTDVKDLGAELDRFTLKLAKLAPWRVAYNSTVDVLRVWRTKDNEVIGEPSPRKVQIDSVPTRLCGIVSAESDSGGKQTMLSVSEAIYKGDDNAREDYLIDIPAIFQIGFGMHRVKAPKGSNEDQTMIALYRTICAAMPVVFQSISMATKLSRLGALDDPEGIYAAFAPVVRKPLDPNDSPNALIEIGGWA
jgi:hypothetical protein